MGEPVRCIECPWCGVSVEADRAMDISTPAGDHSLCQGCHPQGYRRIDVGPEVAHD